MATYPESIRFLYSLQWSGMKFGLRNITRLLAELRNPQRAYRCIHIAGSNGKGTTAALIASMLTAAGYRTGLYSSPHVVDFTERIRVNGRPISKREVTAILAGLRPAIERTRATFFEATTALALEHFRRSNVEVAVLETGLGGRLDATNVIRPVVSVITSISREHEAILGRGLRRIAREKGGIIKRRVPVVVGDIGGVAHRVLQGIARRRSAPYRRLGSVRTRILEESIRGTRFHLRGLGGMDGEFMVPLVGRTQVRNAALALRVLEEVALTSRFAVDRRGALRGLSRVARLGGLGSRFEVLEGKPTLITDVAHNPAAIRSLVRTIERLGLRKVTVVLGLMKDKDLARIVRLLSRVASRVIAVQPSTERARPSAQIVEACRKAGLRVTDGGSVVSGMHRALDRARRGIVVVTGSHFVVGEMLAARQKKRYLTINQ